MKRCPFCAEDIQDAAIVCKHCGRDLATGKSDRVVVTVQRAWNPGVAAVLSLIIPGAGQMYQGKVGTGLVWLLSTVIGYAAFLIPGLVLHLICIVDAASGDPSATSPPPDTPTPLQTMAAEADTTRRTQPSQPAPDSSNAKLLSFSGRTWIWIAIAVVAAIITAGLWSDYARNQATIEETERRRVAKAEDWFTQPLEAFIARYGTPTGDRSNELEKPRPRVVTRTLTYEPERVRAVYEAPAAARGAPPPYSDWRLSGFRDSVTDKPLGFADVRQRLQSRSPK